MTTQRIQNAISELTAAIIEHIEGGGAGVPSSSPAPAAAFARAQPQTTSDFGKCPVHGVEWRTTKGDGSPAKRAYCSQLEDGNYCSEKGPWLQSR
jgi:hypothetical protein